MVVFPAKRDIEETLLEERVRELSGSIMPDLAWVDNLAQNYRFWGIYPLFEQGGALTRDVILPLDAYGIFLPKGSKIEKTGEKENAGWSISGGISFHYTGAAVRLEKVEIDGDGTLRFPFPGSLLGASFGTGIRYAVSAYDEQAERSVFRTVYSDVFALEENVQLEVCFFPAAVSANRWHLTGQAYARTSLRTAYLQKVRLCLPEGFGFELAEGVGVNGRAEVYFTPSGNAKIEGEGFLMPGLSGTERIKMGGELRFCPGGSAFFEDVEIQAKPDTAYLSFSSAVYYCQPENMSFYNESKEGIYEYAPLPGVALGPVGLPVFPFGTLRENSDEAARLEEIYLRGIRRRIVEGQIRDNNLCEEGISYAVTRSGMKAAYNSERLIWMQVAPLQEMELGLAYTAMCSRFWFALLSSKLFLALTELGGMASVPYSVTLRSLMLARAAGYPDTEKLASLCGRTFYTADELKTAVEGEQAVWESSIKEACCHFNQNLAGWEFRCSPGLWSENKMLAVLKMVGDMSMDECMEASYLWGIEPKKEDEQMARQYYADIAALAADSRLRRLAEIMKEPGWRGSVFFMAGVDIAGMPQELSFLAKGIDADKFRAAYVAFSAVSISAGSQSQGSALIHYEDSRALHPEEYHEFGLKVRRLQLDIRENKIYRFQASVELLVNELFGYKTIARADEEGCSLVFDGSYQEDEGRGYYAFVLARSVEYILDNCGIRRVRIESASLRTEGENACFVLGGSLLLEAGEHADLLSFEKLPFDGLVVEMKTTGDGYDFRADYKGLVLRPQDGVLRKDSFGAMFPAKISRMLMHEKKKVSAMGFDTLKMKGYVDDEALGEDWEGFLWLIETGNMGGLAAAVNLTLELLTAFGPDPKNPKGLPHLYCGIRIQSLVRTDTFALPLQGIMSLGFDSMELKKDENFYFRFRNFSLTILGKRFPESNNDMYLITDGKGNLGWYAAAEG